LAKAPGRVDRAAEVIRPIHERLARSGKHDDGWISEDYAECLLAADRDAEATPHFKVAYELVKNEPAKLQRLRSLTGEP
jgi:hypothetical protein